MRFRYRALQHDGRAVSGLIEAYSERGAQRDLVRRGMQPTSITAAAVSTRPVRRRGRWALRRAYGYMLKQMEALVARGVPIADAATALAESGERLGTGAACAELTTRLRRGEAFPHAFEQCFPMLPGYVHRIVEAGDLSGRLAEGLADAAAELEHEARVRAELRSALIYPTFLVGSGMLALLFIFVIVVPRFAVTFRGRLDQLPLISRLVIVTGMWFREHLLLAAVMGTIVAAVSVYGSRRPGWHEHAHRFASRLPLVGTLLMEVDTARWAAVFARLLENRVSLMRSLEVARTTLGDGALRQRLTQVERDVRAGTTLGAALETSAFLPPTALALIRVGERAGNLSATVRSVADIYDEQVRNRIKTALSIIEPVAILLIGSFVGFIAVAIFLAITSINNIPGL